MSQPYFDELGNPIIPDIGQYPSHDGSPLASAPPSTAPSLQELEAAQPGGPDVVGTSPQAYTDYIPDSHFNTVGANSGGNGETRFDPNAEPVAPQYSPDIPTALSLPGQSPAPAVTPGTAGVVKKGSLDQQVDDSIHAYGDAEKAKGLADLNVQGALADRTATAEQQYRNQLTQADQTYQASRASLEQKADQETASWLQDQMKLAEKEPVRSRYWENQSGLGKAIWMMSVGLQAFANSKTPGAPNMVAQMLMHEVEQDTAAQKDRLGREVDAGNQRGKMLKDKQAQRLHDSEDDYSKTFQRLESVKRELLDRAKRPGSAEAAAVAAGATQTIDKLMMQQVEQKRTEAVTAEGKALDRAHDWAKQAAAQNFSRQEQDRGFVHDDKKQQALFDQQAKEKELDRIEKERLATMASSEKMALEQAKKKTGGASEDPTARKFDPSITGLGIQMPAVIQGRQYDPYGDNLGTDHANPEDFKPTIQSLKVPDKHYAEAGKALSAYQQSYGYLARLAKASKTVGGVNYLINNDPEFLSAMSEATAAKARAQNGSRPTDKDQELAQRSELGIDVGSLLGRLKGLTTAKEQKELIDRELANLPVRAQTEMGTRFGAYIPDGGKLVFTPPDMTGPVTKPNSAETTEAGYGAPSSSVPVTSENYTQLRSAQEKTGKDYLPPLPKISSNALGGQSLDEAVTNTINDLQGSDREGGDRIYKGSIKALEDYRKEHPEHSKQVDDAEIRVTEESKPVAENAKRDQEAVQELISHRIYGASKVLRPGHYRELDPVTPDEVESALAARGITRITTERSVKLVNNINAALKAFNEAHQD